MRSGSRREAQLLELHGRAKPEKSRVRGLERNLELDPSKTVYETTAGRGAGQSGVSRGDERNPRVSLGQATKGTRWMPRHQEAMKDVETCEKLWGAGLERRSIDLRIGKPGGRHGPSSYAEYIGVRG